MAYRLDIKRILSMNFFHDLPQIMLGCALAAIATDLFLIPNGLAAGGVTGLATIIQAVGASRGLSLPVGIQTIVMNALLLLVVMREGGMFYVVQRRQALCCWAFSPTCSLRLWRRWHMPI